MPEVVHLDDGASGHLADRGQAPIFLLVPAPSIWHSSLKTGSLSILISHGSASRALLLALPGLTVGAQQHCPDHHRHASERSRRPHGQL